MIKEGFSFTKNDTIVTIMIVTRLRGRHTKRWKREKRTKGNRRGGQNKKCMKEKDEDIEGKKKEENRGESKGGKVQT